MISAKIARENRKRRRLLMTDHRLRRLKAPRVDHLERIPSPGLHNRCHASTSQPFLGCCVSGLPYAGNSVQASDFGSPECICEYCGAIFWYEERVRKAQNHIAPRFAKCCLEGKIKLPLLRPTPPFLDGLLDCGGGPRSSTFRRNIRSYNSMFTFTSTGGRIDNQINLKPGPHVFRISGQNYHRIGSLLPIPGQRPKFAQLYIYDTENEISNRIAAIQSTDGPSQIDAHIVEGLIAMFDTNNEIVKAFRMARDRFREGNFSQVRVRLIGSRRDDGPQYIPPTFSEIAGLIVGDFGEVDRQRDIVVEHRSEGLKRISDLHPNFMSMQYPILFPYGEDGYRLGITYGESPVRKKIKRGTVTMNEYYAFRVQQRLEEGKILLRGGRLFQQYLVDAFTCIEEERIDFARRNQQKLRSEVYQGIRDAVFRGDVEGKTVGKRIILPSSFTGGPRYMMQNYQDAMAICRCFGNPDLFITFTCNARWREIIRALDLIPGQKAEDRPDIVARVFKMKLDNLMDDIRKGHCLGKTIAVMYTIEFQKRGLPHAHILVWMHADHKYPTPVDIDKVIVAEMPDKNYNPHLYELVAQFMMHGPCGKNKISSPCMSKGYCSKHYPKRFNSETTIDRDGFASYRRRDDGKYVERHGVPLDNRYVVPYNPYLIMKYESHINAEWCNQSRSIKYLFKYINKGPDRARIVIEDTQKDQNTTTVEHRVIDEIKNYLDCRYISAYEAAWRIYHFDIHCREPAVEHLSIHLPNMQAIVYHDNENLPHLLERVSDQKTMFTEWMRINQVFDDARDLTYVQFPTKWVWHRKEKTWTRRKQGYTIGRIIYVHPSAGELYYMRMLLNFVKGPRSFEEIRTVNGNVYPSFQSACEAFGLLGNDKEWHEALEDASQWRTSAELRHLFITIIMHCEVADPINLFNVYWKTFSDDIAYQLKRALGQPDLDVPDQQLSNYLLIELERILNKNGSSLKEHNLPTPAAMDTFCLDNRLIREELNYNIDDLQSEHLHLFEGLNNEQRKIYDVIIDCIDKDRGGFHFVYGFGGTGKTYLWRTIISKLRSQYKIVLAVASSGIASLLLPGGRTAHSRFKIPIDLHEWSTCQIKKGTHLAQLLERTSLILWDEAPMNHKHCFEALDKSLRDILHTGNSDNSSRPFGGKTVALGGDFRQILPVVTMGTREDIINASITRSKLWDHCHVHTLQTNMRLTNHIDSHSKEQITQFSKWLLDVGDGKVHATRLPGEDEATWVKIPDIFLIRHEGNSINNICSVTYDHFPQMYNDPAYLKERAIVTPFNETVDIINSHLLALVPTEETIYLSSDEISKSSDNVFDHDILYPSEYLNSLNVNGLPPHKLSLKVGIPVMLLRNINQASGLCNGTRLMIRKLARRVIDAEIITGNNVGQIVFIPRITLSVTNKKWPFIFKRRQFPLRTCYAMTINKSQGQTLKTVGLYLPKPIFTHGQLYVALSRVSSQSGLHILIEKKDKEPDGCTRNIVYKEIFEHLPSGCYFL